MKRHERVMRAAIFAAIAAAVVATAATGCSSSEKGGSSGAAGALKDATGVEWVVTTDPDTAAITFATPKNGPYAIPGQAASLDQTTLAFLEKHKSVFKMKDPKTELVFDRTDRESDGTSHVRFSHRVGTVPVFTGVWIAHFDSAGRVSSMSGNYVAGAADVNTTPTIQAADAESAAKAETLKRNPTVAASSLTVAAPTLEVFPVRGGAPVLAYMVSVRATGAPVALKVHVDATSGAVRFVENQIRRKEMTAAAPQTYAPYNQTAAPLSFLVSDDPLPKLQATGPGDVQMTVAVDGDPAVTPVASTSAETWSDATKPFGAAIAAQSFAKVVLEYYLAHEKNGAPYRSFDGAGAPLLSVINGNGSGVDNAFWDGAKMNYGDGEVSRLEWPTSASLDTVAHELTHGVNEATAGLVYADGTDSGALDESLADVFAALITHRIRNDDGKDFTFCEDDNNAGTPIRSMIQPGNGNLREPGGFSSVSAMQAGGREVHLDSNIPSHAFYLLTHGGTHEVSKYKVPCGIGWGAADRLYWRVETGFLQPNETFEMFARHSVAVARELSINDRPVACAWVAVGVLTEDQAKNEYGITCEKDVGDAGEDASDAGNILITTPAQLVECSQPIAGPGVSLTE